MKQRENRVKKRRALVSSGTTLRGLILCNWGRTGKLFEEIMAQIFPNLISIIRQIQEALKTRNMKKTTLSTSYQII